ncbi:MAG: hypothetical protein AB1714_11985 [Acidobacteriota bacterium]
MGGGGGWDYDYSESALKKSSKEYAEEAKKEGVVREYEGKESRGIPPPVGRTISTDSPTPLVVAVDVTGSMGEWPKIIFEKLPVLYNEAKLHIPDVEISFAAIGDANVDNFPLQVCDFRKGKDLEEGINSIFPEGGGGAGTKESYELAAYFYARHCQMKKDAAPIFVFCGDEGYYETIKAAAVSRMTGDVPAGDLRAGDVFKELLQKFTVYNLRLEYKNAQKEEEIRQQWEETLGKQMVLKLEDPRRIVDAIIGLVAVAREDIDAFSKRISIRQTPEQVEQVMKTLHPLLARGKTGAPGPKKASKRGTKKASRT